MSAALTCETSVSEDADISFAALRLQVKADHLAEVSPGRAAARAVAVVAVWTGGSGIALAVDRWWAWPVVWWVQALCLVGSSSAMHEATHGALARTRRGNQILATIWGLSILFNAALWRQFHLAHHAYAGTDRDPEPQQEARTVAEYLVSIPLTGAGFVFAQWVISAKATLTGATPDWVRKSGRLSTRVNGALVLVVTAVLALAMFVEPGLVLRLWLGPYIVGLLVVAPATSITEHYGCATNGHSTDPFAYTRTVLTNPVVRFLLWQNNFHAAHHAFPAVPAHNAQRLHQLVATRTTHTSPGYLRFHLDVIRSLASRAP